VILAAGRGHRTRRAVLHIDSRSGPVVHELAICRAAIERGFIARYSRYRRRRLRWEPRRSRAQEPRDRSAERRDARDCEEQRCPSRALGPWYDSLAQPTTALTSTKYAESCEATTSDRRWLSRWRSLCRSCSRESITASATRTTARFCIAGIRRARGRRLLRERSGDQYPIVGVLLSRGPASRFEQAGGQCSISRAIGSS